MPEVGAPHEKAGGRCLAEHAAPSPSHPHVDPSPRCCRLALVQVKGRSQVSIEVLA